MVGARATIRCENKVHDDRSSAVAARQRRSGALFSSTPDQGTRHMRVKRPVLALNGRRTSSCSGAGTNDVSYVVDVFDRALPPDGHLRSNSRIVRWPFLFAHAIGRAHPGASASTGSAPRSRNSLTSSGRCHRQAQPSGVLSSR